MKKEIKVFVKGCDNCKRHDMELPTCIGCGISLCGFCSSERADKRSMTIHNKYKCFDDGYRTFDYLKFDEKVHFCLECLINPQKHKVAQLLTLCIKKEKLEYDYREKEKQYNKQLNGFKDKIYHKIQNAKEGRYKETFWEVLDCNGTTGEEVKE